MAALKGAEIDAYVAQPDARLIALVYGVDAGLVRERVEALLAASVDDVNDPFALVRVEADTLTAHPQRLLEEAHTVPLFGGRRALWVKAGGANIAAAVEALLADPPQKDCRVVIEAGDLRKGAPLRALVEQAKGAVALACYADSERDLARLVTEELRAAKLSIAPDAQALLVSLLGGDRKASRNEIRKLALHAHGKERVEADDVLAVVADASSLAVDSVIDATFAGRIQVFD
ncbi:MAG: DNA polymerase III subunit delta, partial [Rhodoplanes sp.]